MMERTLKCGGMTSVSEAQVTSALVRLTLDSCRDSCPYCLGSGREMHGLSPSRRLARRWLNLTQIDQIIEVDSTGEWKDQLDLALATNTRLRLRFGDIQRTEVTAALVQRLASQYDRGYTLGGFFIASVTRHASDWEMLVRIDDMEVH
ncbi:hypothetical protein D3C73_1147430 [compost metagenome]